MRPNFIIQNNTISIYILLSTQEIQTKKKGKKKAYQWTIILKIEKQNEINLTSSSSKAAGEPQKWRVDRTGAGKIHAQRYLRRLFSSPAEAFSEPAGKPEAS